MPKTETAGIKQRVAPLTIDEFEDAAFRACDLAWSVVLDQFTKQHEETGLTYKALGDRIGRKKSQVQRWLASPFNMNIRSLGLLAEGLGVDLLIELQDRTSPHPRVNYLHPAEQAKASFDDLQTVQQMYLSGPKLLGASPDHARGIGFTSSQLNTLPRTGHAGEVVAPPVPAWETIHG